MSDQEVGRSLPLLRVQGPGLPRKPEKAARRIARVIARARPFAVVPWQMALVGLALKCLPRWLYDRLFARAPHKPRGLV